MYIFLNILTIVFCELKLFSILRNSPKDCMGNEVGIGESKVAMKFKFKSYYIYSV